MRDGESSLLVFEYENCLVMVMICVTKTITQYERNAYLVQTNSNRFQCLERSLTRVCYKPSLCLSVITYLSSLRTTIHVKSRFTPEIYAERPSRRFAYQPSKTCRVPS